MTRASRNVTEGPRLGRRWGAERGLTSAVRRNATALTGSAKRVTTANASVRNATLLE
jgi:hypothetical protein